MQPTPVALAVGVVLFVFHQLVLRTGGRTWPLPVVALAVVALVLDAAVAAWGQRRPVVSVALGPDATAGGPVEATVRLDQPAGRRVALRLSSLPSERIELDAPSTGRFDVLAERRGVVRHVVVELVHDGPLGLARVVRSLPVALAEPLVVGPAPRHVEGVALPPAASGDHDRPRPERQGELTRAVREHRPGDPLRHVHWPATARHGRLMSRELEQPGARAVEVVAELGPLEGADAERAAGFAAHAVAVLLDRGAQVELVTREPAGVVSGPVTNRRGAGRRLAAAVAGPPVPRGEGSALVVTPSGCRVEPRPGPAAAPGPGAPPGPVGTGR